MRQKLKAAITKKGTDATSIEIKVSLYKGACCLVIGVSLPCITWTLAKPCFIQFLYREWFMQLIYWASRNRT